MNGAHVLFKTLVLPIRSGQAVDGGTHLKWCINCSVEDYI